MPRAAPSAGRGRAIWRAAGSECRARTWLRLQAPSSVRGSGSRLSAWFEMKRKISAGYSSFPQQRESRIPRLQRLPWTPAFAGVTSTKLIFCTPFRVGLSERQLHAFRQLEAAGQLLHLLLGVGGDFAPGVVERRNDPIFHHLDLVRVDQGLVELDLLQIALAVQVQLDHPAPGDAGHPDGFELRLHLGHLLLHRLRLFHQLADVFHIPSSSVLVSSTGSTPRRASSTSGSAAAKRSRTAAMVAPGKVSSTARTSG